MQRRGAHNELGRQGEDLAAGFLVGKGYSVVDRNLELAAGEVDILARQADFIVVVEVKTQRIAKHFNPIEKVDWQKQRKLQTLAQIIAAKYPDTDVRVDAVTVYWLAGKSEPIITHLENILAQ